jgi:hypothetical protein
MTDHVSDLQWDRLLGGELAGDAGEAARAHAAGCTACGARLRAIVAERDAFRLRPIGFPLSRPRRGWRWRWFPVLVPAAVAAALIALWPRVRAPVGHRTEDPVVAAQADRVKGHGQALLLYAGRPGALSPVASGDVVHPGDYLQAGYTAAQDGFGAVVSRDGAGAVTVYVPPDGDAMVPLAAGRERSFPRSTILDATLGGERIAIVWCQAAHPLAPLVDALRAGWPVAAPAGCTVREVTLDKRAAGSDLGTGDGVVPPPSETANPRGPDPAGRDSLLHSQIPPIK